jgi:S-disulfanyl-L-cysteine oxidoreductase SoxD
MRIAFFTNRIADVNAEECCRNAADDGAGDDAVRMQHSARAETSDDPANMVAMKFKLAAALVVITWAVSLTLTARAEQAAPAEKQAVPAEKQQAATGASSTWSGVYTEEQAKLGAEAYTKHCSECHLEDLAGDGFAPALKGPEFMNNWNSLSVGDLYERVRVSMPPSNPGAVSAKEKADIIAHILKNAGFPAGTTELASQTDALKTIKFEALKPGI